MLNDIHIRDLIFIFKKYFKTFISSVGIVTAISMILFFYNSYTNNQVEYYEDELVELSDNDISQILSKEPEEIYEEEFETVLNSLEIDQVYFDFYVENSDQTPFTNTTLTNELLTNPTVINDVEGIANEEVFPTPALSVRVNNSDVNNAMRLTVSTGELERNYLIAQAYYELINDGSLELFEDRSVQMISTEPTEVEEDFNDRLASDVELFSAPLGALMFIIGILLGSVVGIIAIVIKIENLDEISHLYNLRIKENDQIIDFHHLETPSMVLNRLSSLIDYSSDNQKLVLYEDGTMTDEKLSALKEQISMKQNLLVNDFSLAKKNNHIDEVLILVRLYKTNKSWYNDQMIQLKRINSPITVVLI